MDRLQLWHQITGIEIAFLTVNNSHIEKDCCIKEKVYFTWLITSPRTSLAVFILLVGSSVFRFFLCLNYLLLWFHFQYLLKQYFFIFIFHYLFQTFYKWLSMFINCGEDSILKMPSCSGSTLEPSINYFI